jgi:hypothetical protein
MTLLDATRTLLKFLKIYILIFLADQNRKSPDATQLDATRRNSDATRRYSDATLTLCSDATLTQL